MVCEEQMAATMAVNQANVAQNILLFKYTYIHNGTVILKIATDTYLHTCILLKGVKITTETIISSGK